MPLLNGIFKNGKLRIVLFTLGGTIFGGIAVNIASDLMWLHDHRIMAPQLIAQYTEDHYQMGELKRNVEKLIVSVEKLTEQVRLEREERIREKRK